MHPLQYITFAYTETLKLYSKHQYHHESAIELCILFAMYLKSLSLFTQNKKKTKKT